MQRRPQRSCWCSLRQSCRSRAGAMTPSSTSGSKMRSHHKNQLARAASERVGESEGRSPSGKTTRAALAAVQVALFLAAICAPLLVNLTGVDGGDPQTENRQLASLHEGVF